MRTFRGFLLAVAALTAVSASMTGCLETKTEYWFRSDGSGKVVFDLGVSKQLSPKMGELVEKAKREIAENDDRNVRNASVRTYDDGDISHVEISFDVVDMTLISGDSDVLFGNSLGGGGDEGNKEKMMDGVTIKRLPSGNILFERKFKRPDAEQATADGKKDGDEAMANAMAASFLAGKFATVIVHADRIVSANGKISKDRKTVTWKVPMADIIGGKPIPDIKAELSFSQWNARTILAILFVALAIVVPLFVALILLKSFKYKRGNAA